MIPDMSAHDAPLRVFTMSDMRSEAFWEDMNTLYPAEFWVH